MQNRKKSRSLKTALASIVIGLESLLNPKPINAQSQHYSSTATKVLVANWDAWRKTPDFNLDRIVNFSDFVEFGRAFGGADKKYDLNQNETVDFPDFVFFARDFNKEIDSVPEIKQIPKQSLEQVDAMTNPRAIALKDYVSDLFNGDLYYEISNSNGLVASLSADKDSLIFRPRGIFYGNSYAAFKVKKDGVEDIEGRVEAEIQKDEAAVRLYQEARELDGNRKWNKSLTPEIEAVIYIGKGRVLGDSLNARNFTGLAPTQERINEVKEAFEVFFKLSGYSPNIRITDDPNEIYHPKKQLVYQPDDTKFVWFEDNTLGLQEGTAVYSQDKNIKAVLVSTKHDAPKRAIFHGILGHGSGLGHPSSFKSVDTILGTDQQLNDSLIYKGKDYLSRGYTPQDEFVIRAHNDQ